MSKVTDSLFRMLAVPSHSTQESAMAVVFQAELEALGFTVTRDDWGNVIGVLRLGPGLTVLLDGHLDTVPVPLPEVWSRNPAGELHEGTVYGRGAVDMKGPLSSCLHGSAAQLGASATGTIIISGSICEELSEGPALVHVIEGLIAQSMRPDVVIICEPSANQLMLGQRGRAEITIEISGTPCHSAYPEAGVNAAEVMADVITALRAIELPFERELGPAILELIDITSLPFPSQSMLPERCIATFDRRTLSSEHAEGVLAAIRDVVDKIAVQHGASARVTLGRAEFTTGTGVQVAHDVFAPAWLMSENSWPATAAIAGLRNARLPSEPGYYKFCTNGSASAGILGIPTLGFGPGNPAQAHTVDESISVDDLDQGALGYTAILSELLSGVGHS